MRFANISKAKGGVFHEGPLGDEAKLAKGKLHFFYQPQLGTEAELLPITNSGQYDAVIAAATFLPKASVFKLGGVRIGAGTGNMACATWGGGNGEGGEAVLDEHAELQQPGHGADGAEGHAESGTGSGG